MAKIEKEDLFECRVGSLEHALKRQQLDTLNQKEQNLNLAMVLLKEQRSRLEREQHDIEQRLDALGTMLKTKYGVEDENQVNWETGEIKSSPTPPNSEELPDGTDRGVSDVAATGCSIGADTAAGLGSSASGAPGAETTNRGGAEDPGSPVG